MQSSARADADKIISRPFSGLEIKEAQYLHVENGSGNAIRDVVCATPI
jgi:hypothetical protein